MPPSAIPPALVEEGQRMAAICNACRYCEGYCAVFPALERRLSFSAADLAYLANLCHGCASCYYACQYAPPHEFALDFPKLMADIRAESYRRYARPSTFGRLFERGGAVAGAVVVASVALVAVATALAVDPAVLFSAHPDRDGAFYAVIPHQPMAYAFGAAFLLAVVALIAEGNAFWRDTEEEARTFGSAGPLGQAIGDALRLVYLRGGGEGCTYPDDAPSYARRWFHHATFYGFLACFAATAVATIYHYAFGWHAPYPWWSVPVVLGVVGGIGLLVGPAGLLWLKARRDPVLARSQPTAMDVAFLLLLIGVSATGLALLAWRETAAMGTLLIVHLGLVLALFVTLPYGKFVHAIHRFAALVRFHVERRRPLPDWGAE